MLRTRPTTKLGEIGSLALSPEQAAESKFESKLQIELFHKKPCWDVPRKGVQHDAFRVQEEILEIEAQQESFSKQTALDTKIAEKSFQDIRTSQLKLHERFIDVSNFSKQCADKTERAQSQFNLELKEKSSLNEEISELQSELEKLSDFETKFCGIVEELKPVERVFKEVIQDSESFESIEDLMQKFEALMLVQVEVAEGEHEIIKNIELMRQKLLKLTLDTAQKINTLQGETADLERIFNDAKTETYKWEKILAIAKDCVVENEREIVILKGSIKQLGNVFAKRRSEEYKMEKLDASGQLDYIVDEIEIIEEVIRRAKKAMAKTAHA